MQVRSMRVRVFNGGNQQSSFFYRDQATYITVNGNSDISFRIRHGDKLQAVLIYEISKFSHRVFLLNRQKSCH